MDDKDWLLTIDHIDLLYYIKDQLSQKEYVNSIKSEATGNFNLIEIMEEKKMKKLNKLIKWLRN